MRLQFFWLNVIIVIVSGRNLKDIEPPPLLSRQMLNAFGEIMNNEEAIRSFCAKYYNCRRKCDKDGNELFPPVLMRPSEEPFEDNEVMSSSLKRSRPKASGEDSKSNIRNIRSNVKYKSCAELKEAGFNTSGIYIIYLKPTNRYIEMQVYCDMENDDGGWIVIQKRDEFQVPHLNFTRTWREYTMGFGDLEKDFWLGNRNIHILLAANEEVTLRIDMSDFEGNSRIALYDQFMISDATDGYRLTIGGYSGTAGDSMSYSNGSQFATYDHNDNRRCADYLKGGWWYNNCTKANLNGVYLEKSDTREMQMTHSGMSNMTMAPDSDESTMTTGTTVIIVAFSLLAFLTALGFFLIHLIRRRLSSADCEVLVNDQPHPNAVSVNELLENQEVFPSGSGNSKLQLKQDNSKEGNN